MSTEKANEIYQFISEGDLAKTDELFAQAVEEKISELREQERVEVATKMFKEGEEAATGASSMNWVDLKDPMKSENDLKAVAGRVASMARQSGAQNVEDEKFTEVLNGTMKELGYSTDSDAKSRQDVFNKIKRAVRENDLMPSA